MHYHCKGHKTIGPPPPESLNVLIFFILKDVYYKTINTFSVYVQCKLQVSTYLLTTGPSRLVVTRLYFHVFKWINQHITHLVIVIQLTAKYKLCHPIYY